MERTNSLQLWKTFWTLFLAVNWMLTLEAQGVRDLELTIEPGDTVVVPGAQAVLECAANGSAPPDIKWRGDDGQLLNLIGDIYRSQLPNGSLQVRAGPGSPQGLQGSYQCVATIDNIGTIVSRRASLRIAQLPPLTVEPGDLQVLPKQTALFSCLVEATPPAHVRWLKDGRTLHLDESRMVVLPSGSLEIDEVQNSDQGTYRCNVSSLEQSALSASAKLTITHDNDMLKEPMAPEFIARPRNTVAIEGSTVTLDCAANGTPRPWITWLKDGVVIDMADLDSRFLKVGTGSLQITGVEEHDEGTYQCRAENKEDVFEETATLQVQVPPRFLKKPRDRVAFEKEDLELECEVYGKPEPEIIWIKNGDQIPLSEYLQVVNGNNLKIMGLMELDAGVFQCMGTNPAGNVQAASRLTVLKKGSKQASRLGPMMGAFTTPSVPIFPSRIGNNGGGYSRGGSADRAAGSEGPGGSPGAGVPSAPQQLTPAIVSARFVTLSWAKPAQTNGDIITYSVYYKQEGSDRERVQNSTGSRLEEANIAGLSPGKTYRFWTMAYNINGAGPISEPLLVQTKAEVKVPGPPKDLKAFATSPTSILVKWKPPDPTPAGPVQSYTMFYMEGDSDEEHKIETKFEEYELTGLAKFTDYNVWVVAANENGDGASTEELAVRTMSDVPSEPPQNVTLEPSSSTSVIVRWEPPPKEGQNGIITGYKLRYRKRDRKARGETVAAAGNRRLFPLTGLERRSTYQVRLWAQTVNGTGPPTEWYTVETYQNDLDESQVPGPPTNLKARAQTDSISVSWAPPHDQTIMVRGYTLGWGKGIPDAYTQVLDGKQRSYDIKGLDANSEYVISLRAYNEMGDGRPSYSSVRTREMTAPEPPAPLVPPVGLTATVLSPSTVVVFWTDTSLSKAQVIPASDNRYYVVRYTSSHNSPNTRYKYYNATDLNCMIDDLKPNTQYEFTVKVVKGRRESPWSMVVLNMTQEAAPNSQPRDLTVVPLENTPNAVNLNWQPPKQPNGVITGYVIFYTTDNTLKDRDWAVEGVLGDKMTTTIRGLLSDKKYYFKIQARNKKGYGPVSNIVPFTTPPSNGLLVERSLTNKDGRGGLNNQIYYIILGCFLTLVFVVTISLLVVCCRRKGVEQTKKGYLKNNAKNKPSSKTNIKPPDLWIHHDQMELKALEKTQSLESGPSGVQGATTLPRTGPGSSGHDFDSPEPPLHHPSGTNSLDKRTYVSSYIAIPQNDEPATSTLRRGRPPKPLVISGDARIRDSISTAPSLSGSNLQQVAGTTEVRPMYPRTQYTISRAHVTLDQAAQSPENPYSLQGGYDTVTALPPPISVTCQPIHPPPVTYSTGMGPGTSVVSDPNSGSIGKRLQGHPLKSFSVPAPPPQSAPSTPQQKHIVRPQTSSSPYKKAGILASTGTPPGTCVGIKNRAGNGTGPTTADETAKLQPSYSTEELNQEMANLEGLMKDLNAITASEFEC